MPNRRAHSTNRKRQLRQLLFAKTMADLESDFSKTRGGILWWLADPVLQMGIYYVVFAVLLQRRTEDFVIFLLIGLVSWRWFQMAVSQGAGAILGAKSILQQVKVSPTLFPSVVILKNALTFAVGFAILVLFIWVYGIPINLAYLALPVLLAVQFLLIAGCVYVCAAITPFLPDLRVLLNYMLRAMMFLSGIFFDGDQIPEKLQFWFYLNPVASLIKAYRDILIHGNMPNWTHLMCIAALAVLLLIIGKRLIARYSRLYPRVVL